MGKVRINFGISEMLRAWIEQQPGIIGIVEESNLHIVVEHNLTGPQAQTLRTQFMDKLIESI